MSNDSTNDEREPLLVSCVRCRKLHPAERPLEFHPLCAKCIIPPRG